MSQTFIELQGSTTLTSSRTIINNNFDALKTGFSGTTPPFTASAATVGAEYYNTTDKKRYRVVQQGTNSYVWAIPPENLHTSGSESYSGTLDATSGQINVATQAVSDDSTKAASTAFIKLRVPVSVGSSTKPVYTNASGVITASNATVGSASQPVYLNAGTITAITGALSNNITGNAATATTASACSGNAATATAAITKSQGDNSTNIATTAYVDTGLNTKQATLVSGTNIKTINNESVLGSGNITLDLLPSQAGNAGKFLTTDGSNTSWVAATSTVIRRYS